MTTRPRRVPAEPKPFPTRFDADGWVIPDDVPMTPLIGLANAPKPKPVPPAEK